MSFAQLVHGTAEEMLENLDNRELTTNELQAALTNAVRKIWALQRIVEEHSATLKRLDKTTVKPL